MALADLIAAGRHEPIAIVTIDGVGEYRGPWKFCWPRVPTYAQRDPLYKAWGKKGVWPSILPEKVNPLGGVAESGELMVELVDGVGWAPGGFYDALTDLFRSDAVEVFRLQAAISATALSVALDGTFTALASIRPFEDVFYIGAEALRVGSFDGSSTFAVTRAHLGTDAIGHEAGSPVFLRSPLLSGRRMRYYLTFDDPTADASIETEQGPGWFVDGAPLGDLLASYQIKGRSQLKHLDRLLRRRQGFTGLIRRVDEVGQIVEMTVGPQLTDGSHFRGILWFKHDEEVLGLDIDGAFGDSVNTNYITFPVLEQWRGQGGTSKAPLKEGAELRQVMLADPATGHGSFRYQDRGGETSSRLTGTWLQEKHPIAIALCLLTSSADPTDGLELTNWIAGNGNFSSLPPGFGLGTPAAQIDWASAFQVWRDNPGWELPYLRIEKSESGREFLNREILRPFGITITSRGGRIYFRSFRLPIAGTSGDVWDETIVRSEPGQKGFRRPVLRAKEATQLAASTVVFKLRSPAGGEVELIFTDASLPEVFGDTRSAYGLDQGRIEIEVPGARADVAGAVAMLRQRAIRLLYRYRRAPWELDLDTDLAQMLTDAGDTRRLTFPQLPVRATGTRGWVQVPIEILAKRPDPRQGRISWNALSFAVGGRFGLIAPSAVINGAPSGNVATCHQNRFTNPAETSLPNRDVLGFTIGDRVRLRALAGTIVATTPAYQTVQSINGPANQITLDGNFGGAWVSGHVLVPAGYDSAVQAQRDLYVFYGDDTLTVGSASDPAYTYGEK